MALPVLLHGVLLRLKGNQTEAYFIDARRRVVLDRHPVVATTRAVSHDNVAACIIASATADGVSISCGSSGALLHVLEISGTRLLYASWRGVMATGGDIYQFKVWSHEGEDSWGAHPDTSGVALLGHGVETRALVAMAGIILLACSILGQCDYSRAHVTPNGERVTALYATPGGCIAVCNGGTPHAAVCVFVTGTEAAQATMAVPHATAIEFARHGPPWAVCSDGHAAQLGGHVQCSGATNGFYVGVDQTLALAADGTMLYSAL